MLCSPYTSQYCQERLISVCGVIGNKSGPLGRGPRQVSDFMLAPEAGETHLQSWDHSGWPVDNSAHISLLTTDPDPGLARNVAIKHCAIRNTSRKISQSQQLDTEFCQVLAPHPCVAALPVTRSQRVATTTNQDIKVLVSRSNTDPCLGGGRGLS